MKHPQLGAENISHAGKQAHIVLLVGTRLAMLKNDRAQHTRTPKKRHGHERYAWILRPVAEDTEAGERYIRNGSAVLQKGSGESFIDRDGGAIDGTVLHML